MTFDPYEAFTIYNTLSLYTTGNFGKGVEEVPAFIGLPGAREKAEIGRGLFEQSEFRSPRRRVKRKAGIPDNKRATFLGNFFAAGKKLRSIVILNETWWSEEPHSKYYCSCGTMSF